MNHTQISDMTYKYPEYKLSNRCTIKSSKRVFAKEYVTSGVPFMRSKDIIDKSLGTFNHYDLFISYERFRELKELTGSPQKGDILLSSVGNRSGKSYVVNNEGDFYFKDGNIIWISKFDQIDSHYLSYFFNSSLGQRTLQSVMIGSAQKALTIDSIRNLRITLPNIEVQKAIAHILRTLDEKIEINIKTKENLEGIAKALFKSWFVDFDPVKAKSEGRSTGLPIEINDLFPDSFEDSEIGQIPYGWNNIPLKELIIPIKERQGEQNLDEFSATIYGIEYRNKKFKKILAKSSRKNKVAMQGDLVFGLSRKVLNFGRMYLPIGGFSSVYEVFRSKDEIYIPTEIIEKYIRTKMLSFMEILKPAAREGQAIDRRVLLEKRIPNFPSDLIHYFQLITEPIDSMISLKSKEIFTLEEIRNCLLPKLISGELRLPDVEKMIDEVGI